AAALPCAWLCLGTCGWWARAITVLACVVLSGALAWATTALEPRPPAPGRDHRPLEASADGYVSSRECRACHPQEYATWADSYHRRMTQVATPQNVQAPFDHLQVEDDRERMYLLERRGDEFWVEMDDPEHDARAGPAPRFWRQIVQITGSHHFQFFWYAT